MEFIKILDAVKIKLPLNLKGLNNIQNEKTRIKPQKKDLRCSVLKNIEFGKF